MQTIAEFLVSIGYAVRESEVTTWEATLKKADLWVAKAGAALAAFERRAKDLFASATDDLERLNAVAIRTGSSVSELRALAYALQQVGMNGADAQAVVASFTERLRRLPALTALLRGLGVQVTANGQARDQAEVLRDAVRGLNAMEYPLAARYAEVLGIPEDAYNVMRRNGAAIDRLAEEQKAIFARYGVDADESADRSMMLKVGWRNALMTIDALFARVTMEIVPTLAPIVRTLSDWLAKHQDRIVAVCVAFVAAAGALGAALQTLVIAVFGSGDGLLAFLEWATGSGGIILAAKIITGAWVAGAVAGMLGPLGIVTAAILALVALLMPGQAQASGSGGQGGQSHGGGRQHGASGSWNSEPQKRSWWQRLTGGGGGGGASGSWNVGGEQETFTPSPDQESVPALAEERKRFAEELKDPEVAARLAAYTRAEVGSQGPQAEQAFIESTLNRAAARGQTIRETLSPGGKAGSYFPKITHQKAAQFGADPRTVARYRKTIEAVLGGSNVSGYATGNASGTVGFAGGPQTLSTGGERFGVEGPDIGWARRVRARGMSPFATPPARPMQIDPFDMRDLMEAPPLGAFSEDAFSASQETEIVVHGDPDPVRTAGEVGAAQSRVNTDFVNQAAQVP